MRLIIIHPGIQHAPRLANGAVRAGLFEKVSLLTSVLFKPNQKLIGLLKKRAKTIDDDVYIVNHYLYTLLFTLSRYLYNKIIVNPQNQSHNNPIYFWQQIFGILCLPRLYFQRKNTLVVCFETTGWPIVKYCKKWGIPVIMDFASISHEKAKTLGINETDYGIKLKLKERALIDYGIYCSEFCRKSFEGLTSARKEFVLYLGAERRIEYSVLGSESYSVESLEEKQVASIKNQETCGVEKGIEYSVLSSESSSVGSVQESRESRSKKQETCGVEKGIEYSVLSSESSSVGSVQESRESRSKKQETCGVEKGIEYSVLSSESSSVGSVQEKQGIRESQEPRMKNKENSSFRSETLTNESPTPNHLKTKISFIANLEYRKGLDIFLESIYAYKYPVFLEVHLIGRMRKEWVEENMPKNIVNQQIKLVYQPAMSQGELFDYLAQEQFDLNVQCSRFDSFAMVVPETMMQGIPNVVSPFVGAGEMIKNGVDGFIMEDLDSKSLSDVLNRYIAMSAQEREELRAEVLKSSKEMVWENYYINLASVLKEILYDVQRKQLLLLISWVSLASVRLSSYAWTYLT